jgi:hypothetical protein
MFVNVTVYMVACPLKVGIVQSEEMSVTGLHHSKCQINGATVVHTTTEELCEATFPVGQCIGHIWRIETQLSQSRWSGSRAWKHAV